MEGAQAGQGQRIVVPNNQIEQVLQQEHKNMNLIGMDRFWEFIKGKYANIKRSQVREVVAANPTLQRHQPVRQKKSSRVIIAERPNQRWQIDLTEYSLGAVKFIISMIDIYSRKIYARGVTTKHSRKITQFLESVFEQEHPTILQSDNGTEFKANDVFCVFFDLVTEFTDQCIFSPH